MKKFEYRIKCITHDKCPGLGYTRGLTVALKNGTPVLYELQEAMGAMCEEFFGLHAKVHGIGGPVEDPVYLEAKTAPGIHFKESPALQPSRDR